MIDFYPITSINDSYFAPLYELYTTSFPDFERRSWAGLDRALNNEKKFSANALLEHNEFVGFLNYWRFDHFIYVEHLALVPQFRSLKKGTIAMEIFKQAVTLPIVLEVEMPSNSEATRRIRFYENLGFKVVSHYYAQPPYEGERFLTPMLIMSNDYHYANSHFDMIKNTLYQEVYRFETQMERNLEE